MKLLHLYAVAWALLASSSAMAETHGASWPWQLLSGGYDSSVVDGRILAYPDDRAWDARFFRLIENSIMTMTADNGGFSRSVMPIPPDCIVPLCTPRSTGSCRLGPTVPECVAQLPWHPGDRWENSNGGRGFTNSFCGGYTGAEGCDADAQLDLVLGGPPTAMDTRGDALKLTDLASGGWPTALLEFVLQMFSGPPDHAVCIAPAGLPEADAHTCAPGMTYRASINTMFASPDAGRQWYPFTAACSLADNQGADAIAVDPGNPGHLVAAKDGVAGQFAEISGCAGASLCSARSIGWTRDVSAQVKASMLATMPGVNETTRAVDAAGGPTPTDPGNGWRYAALGHLALGQQCDVAHAGMQIGCYADKFLWCHALQPDGQQVGHEAYCPDQTLDACKCAFAGSTIPTAFCQFPEPHP